jgi:hypothetical protein
VAKQKQPDDPFAQRWLRKERDAGLGELGTEFVHCNGGALPVDAAPFLSFAYAEEAPYLWQVFGLPQDWSATDRARLGAYPMIGSDGAGNPLCVEEPTGAVWLLDHEDRFRTRQFVNSGVPQLAECLLAYLGERDAGRFRQAVAEIDAPAIAECTFWWHEAAGLEAE